MRSRWMLVWLMGSRMSWKRLSGEFRHTELPGEALYKEALRILKHKRNTSIGDMPPSKIEQALDKACSLGADGLATLAQKLILFRSLARYKVEWENKRGS